MYHTTGFDHEEVIDLWSTCAVCRARVSPVRSPHECISVKNAAACHRHGELVSSLAAAVKNPSISWRLSR